MIELAYLSSCILICKQILLCFQLSEVVRLSINVTIPSLLFVNVAPVLYLLWLLSDSLFILLLLHLNVFAVVIISSCMVRCLTES